MSPRIPAGVCHFTECQAEPLRRLSLRFVAKGYNDGLLATHSARGSADLGDSVPGYADVLT